MFDALSAVLIKVNCSYVYNSDPLVLGVLGLKFKLLRCWQVFCYEVIDIEHQKTKDINIYKCCIFWPVFGYWALQMLAEICFFTFVWPAFGCKLKKHLFLTWFACFFFLLLLFWAKMRKKHIWIFVQSAQYPNVGWNLQHINSPYHLDFQRVSYKCSSKLKQWKCYTLNKKGLSSIQMSRTYH